MSIVIIVSLQRKLKHQKKKKNKIKKLKLIVLVPSSGCHPQSSPFERMARQMGYVGARAKARVIYLRWNTCLHG